MGSGGKQGEAKVWWADRVRGGAGAELDVLAPGEYESEELEDSGAHTVGAQGADSSLGLRHLDSINGAEPGVGGERQGIMAEGMADATDGDVEGYTIEGEPYPEATEATGESLSEKLQLRQADVVREMVRKKALDLARAHNVSAAIAAFDKPGNPFLMESEEEQEECGGEAQDDGEESVETEPDDQRGLEGAVPLAQWQRSLERLLKDERISFLQGRLAVDTTQGAYSMEAQLDAGAGAAALRKQLLSAARAGQVDNVSLAIQGGAPVDAADLDFHNWTALHMAADKGHLEVVDLLLYYGAKVHARETALNMTALHLAAHNGRAAVCRCLVNHGADPQALAGDSAVSPVMLAAENAHLSSYHEHAAAMLRLAAAAAHEREAARVDGRGKRGFAAQDPPAFPFDSKRPRHPKRPADEGARAHTALVAEGDIQEVWHEEIGQAPGLSQGPDAGPSEWQEASDPFQ